jgi:hypothetical protein
VSLVLFLLVMTGSILAIIEAPIVIKYFNDIGCKLSAIIDDMAYGRISPTVDNRFFVGLDPLKKELEDFDSHINTFFS